MGTAVLHPQDCLAAPQSDQNHRVLCVSECPPSVARPKGRALSATSESSIPAAECGRDVALCNTIRNRGGGLLSCNQSSAGLLPLPDRVWQSAHSTSYRLAPKIAVCRSREFADSYVSKHFTSLHHSNFSSYVRISRCPSVPMLDHAARARRVLSGCFPLHGVQLHERRPQWGDARFFFNSAEGNCMAVPSSWEEFPSQKLKFSPNSHFSDVFNPVRLKRAENTVRSGHYRKRMHPELSQVEINSGRQCAKPPFKVLPDGQGKSICTYTNTVGRKFGVYKQLKRSASEKLQKRSETPFLQRPGTNEAAKKLIKNLSQGVVGSHTKECCSSKVEVKLASSASPASLLEGKIEKGPHVQVSIDADTQGRRCVGAAKSMQVPFSLQTGCIKSNVGAALHGQCYSTVNAAVEHKEANEGGQLTDKAGSVSQNLCKADATGTFDWQSAISNTSEPNTISGSEGISRSHSSVLVDNHEMWVSMMNDERWAGPSFFNSPPPSSLPVPSFTFLFSRTLSTSSKPTKTTDYNAHLVSDKSLFESKCTWDVAFATKDLRRMLQLDCASCDS